MFKKWFLGFTLAEVMIVLTIIGILAGILIPVANNSRPDKNVMKFKKAHATLANVIHELVTSDKYYKDGDLGRMANGDLVNSATYLCETIADIVSTKKVNCSSADNGQWHVHLCKDNGVDNTPTMKSNLDNWCKLYQNNEIETTDKIIYYQVSPACHFAVNWSDGDTRLFGYIGWNDTLDTDEYGNVVSMTAGQFDLIYKPFCIDIDGIPKNDTSNGKNCDDVKDVCPFGYGIRADGKILTGARADEWLEKGFQRGKNEN